VSRKIPALYKVLKMKTRKIFYAAIILCVLAAAILFSCIPPIGTLFGDNKQSIPPPGAGDQKTVTIPGLPPFNLRYVPATPAGGFQRDAASTYISTISAGYWMGETEVTQELFEAVMGVNPSRFQGGGYLPDSGEIQEKRPVEQVGWYYVIAFCNKLSLKDGKAPVYTVSGISNWAALPYGSIPVSDDATWDAATVNAAANGYRLPTEMQWMWAAMGATSGGTDVETKGYKKEFAGDADMDTTGQSPDSYAWYLSNASTKTHEVSKKLPNELGLLDMSGSVWEWCWDWSDSYPSGTVSDYTGAAVGTARIIRGGGWVIDASNCTVAYRYAYAQYTRSYVIGLRVICP
jgi:formylglycine-generating enzyme required for sulfatase activity